MIKLSTRQGRLQKCRPPAAQCVQSPRALHESAPAGPSQNASRLALATCALFDSKAPRDAKPAVSLSSETPGADQPTARHLAGTAGTTCWGNSLWMVSGVPWP